MNIFTFKCNPILFTHLLFLLCPSRNEYIFTSKCNFDEKRILFLLVQFLLCPDCVDHLAGDPTPRHPGTNAVSPLHPWYYT